MDVGEVHLGLEPPPFDQVECTKLLAFLYDPNRRRLGLKELALDLLGIKPRERDALFDWLRANVPAAKRKKDVGEFIAHGPGHLVRDYALKGDAGSTLKLWRFLHRDVIQNRGMTAAYDRERALIEVLLDMERTGVPIDVDAMSREVATWERSLDVASDWVRKRLRAPGLDVDSPDQLADAIEDADLLVPEGWFMTEPTKTRPEGSRSTAIPQLRECLTDPDVVNVLAYRSKLATSLRSFARPWLRRAEADGHVYPFWNAVATESKFGGGKKIGARTGRLSANPSLMNVPKTPPRIAFSAAEAKRILAEDDEATIIPMPSTLRGKVADLPYLRRYVVGGHGRGSTVYVRDYSQQELRILAHFAGGALERLYNEDPRVDLHSHAQQLINRRLGRSFARKPIKNTGFGIIYGMGLYLLAASVGTDVKTAKEIRDAYLAIFPGLEELVSACQKRGRYDPDDELSEHFLGEPIVTWGGRENFVERSAFSKKYKRRMTFEYKLINTLIQGSAADCTKQAMLNYFHDGRREGRMILQVHDEIVGGAASKTAARRETELLRQAMESVAFDVPMLSDGTLGRTWADAAIDDKPAKQLFVNDATGYRAAAFGQLSSRNARYN